jgi:hypothetical protein
MVSRCALNASSRDCAIVSTVCGGCGFHTGHSALSACSLPSPRNSCDTTEKSCPRRNLDSETVPHLPVPIPKTTCVAGEHNDARVRVSVGSADDSPAVRRVLQTCGEASGSSISSALPPLLPPLCLDGLGLGLGFGFGHTLLRCGALRLLFTRTSHVSSVALGRWNVRRIACFVSTLARVASMRGRNLPPAESRSGGGGVEAALVGWVGWRPAARAADGTTAPAAYTCQAVSE